MCGRASDRMRAMSWAETVETVMVLLWVRDLLTDLDDRAKGADVPA
jgi:hypothetical protein